MKQELIQDGNLVATATLRIPLEEFEFTYARSSGPGGQNVNKVNSKAVLRWPVQNSTSLPDGVRERFLQQNRNRITLEGELVITSQRFRDQPKNVTDCLEKLRDLLATAAIVPKVRKPTRPTRGSIRRRLENKRRQSERKEGRRRPDGE